MSKPTDIRCIGARLYFLPLTLRIPLKFGFETATSVICARVSVRVSNAKGEIAEGWGETPLSVSWVWPSSLSYGTREMALQEFCIRLAQSWSGFDIAGHALEVGHAFLQTRLHVLWNEFNKSMSSPPGDRREMQAASGDKSQNQNSNTQTNVELMPWLAALVCCSPFDLALHDAYGMLNNVPVYQTYNDRFLNADLGKYISPAEGSRVSFSGRYPEEFFAAPMPNHLQAWHLIGGKDLLREDELTGSEPKDGYPTVLTDWIQRDGLRCLKIKLRGNDSKWDYQRIVDVGKIALEHGAIWLTADFNCTVTEPVYVNEILDRLLIDHPRFYGMLLYVEQPFPYDLEENQIDVHSVSARKPLFMDESAHDWKMIKLGRSLGWSGVALKTCKTQTGALLSLCWAKAHGMTLMVQDLTNPMLAQIPHVLLAAHAGTIMGVETNSMQFYPEASKPEAAIHPEIYRRREGQIDLSTISGPGFGYRIGSISRALPSPAVTF